MLRDIMESENEVGYCIVHGRMHEVYVDDEGNLFHHDPASSNLVCYGEFATCAPPVMVEEEWDSIMEQEKFIEEVLIW